MIPGIGIGLGFSGRRGSAAVVVPRKIMPLGDSITFGATVIDPTERSSTNLSWANQYIARCNGLYQMQHNGGVPGDKTDQMLARLPAELALYTPDIVTIMGGTNNSVNVGWGTTYTVASTAQHLSDMVALVKASGAEARICTIPYNSIAPRDRIEGINTAVLAIAAAEGLRVLDLASLLNADGLMIPSYTPDGMHLNIGGAGFVGASLAAQETVSCEPSFLPHVGDTISGNQVSDPLFLTDTDGDGVPNGWVRTNPSPTITYSLTSDTRGFRWVNANRLGTTNISLYYDVVAPVFTIGGRCAIGLRQKAATSDAAFNHSVALQFMGGSTIPLTLTLAGVSIGEVAHYREFIIPTGTTGIRILTTLGGGTGQLSIATPLFLDLS